MLRKIINNLLFFNSPRAELKAIQSQLMEENRKFCIIWSSCHVLFWAYCLFMTLRDPLYHQCRSVYIGAFASSAAILALSVFAAPRRPRLVRLLAIGMDEVLLVAGILIARNLAPKTIVVFAAVLIVPVSYITDTLSTLVILIINAILFSLVCSGRMDPETYRWVLSNLCIFSIMGIMLGHFVNKTRFERYVFAESNAALAKEQARHAQYDELTDLRNRRVYAESINRLSKELPAECKVILADINGLKQINDTYGHSAGDELIIGSAECIRSCFQGIDQIFRIGGDEFAIIITSPGYDVEGALERLKKACAGWNGQYIHGIAMSAGVATAEEFPDIDSIVKAADKRMYAAKREYYQRAGNDRRTR